MEGGWPCQQYPEGWQARARELLEDYQQQLTIHGPSRRIVRRTESLTSLLRKCVDDPLQLSEREVGAIRFFVAYATFRRGLPDSQRNHELRRVEEGEAVLLARGKELCGVLIARLENLPQYAGLDSSEEVLGPVTATEAQRFGLPAGHTFPNVLTAKVYRCVNTSLEDLVHQGAISSAGALAMIIPKLTIVPMYDIDRQAQLDLYTALGESVDTQYRPACRRCGRPRKEGRLVCQWCAGSLLLTGRLWQVAVGASVVGAVALGILLAIILGGAEDTGLGRVGEAQFTARSASDDVRKPGR